MLFPRIESNNEQNSGIVDNCDTTVMIQNDLCVSYDNSEVDNNVFDDELFCNNEDDESYMFGTEIYRSVNVDDTLYPISGSKIDSQTSYYKPWSSKFQSFTKAPEIFDLPDTDTVLDSTMSFANQSNSSLNFNQSQASNRNTWIK